VQKLRPVDHRFILVVSAEMNDATAPSRNAGATTLPMMRASWSIDGDSGSSSFILEVHLAFINRHAWRPTKYQVVLELDFWLRTTIRPNDNSISYLVTESFVGVTVLSGAAAEIENVNHVFQPDGRRHCQRE
jgi:hypothetical protein